MGSANWTLAARVTRSTSPDLGNTLSPSCPSRLLVAPYRAVAVGGPQSPPRLMPNVSYQPQIVNRLQVMRRQEFGERWPADPCPSPYMRHVGPANTRSVGSPVTRVLIDVERRGVVRGAHPGPL
jgi:hypothetical protein